MRWILLSDIVRWTKPGQPNEGILWPPYEVMRVILNALYGACKVTQSLLRVLGQLVLLLLPSGIKVVLMDAWEIPDFRQEKRYFDSFNLTIGGFPVAYRHPLPKDGVRRWWAAFVSPIDIHIPGSEHYFYFKTNKGFWKRGDEYDPVRRYQVIGHGIIDASMVGIMYAIAKALKKVGLIKTAYVFLRSLLKDAYFINKIFFDGEDDVTEDDVDKILDEIQDVEEDVEKVSEQLGVRLIFG